MSTRQEQPPSSTEPVELLQEQKNPAVRRSALHLLKNEPEWVLQKSGMDQRVRDVLGDDFYDDYQAQRRELDQRFQ